MKKMQSVCYMVAFFLCVLCLFFVFSQRQDSRGAEGGPRDITGQTAITRAGHGEYPDCFQKEETFPRPNLGENKGEEDHFLRLLPLFLVLFSCALVFLFSGETKASLYAFFRLSFLLNDPPLKRIFIVQYKDGKKRLPLFI